jgi:hypothetical protein
MIPLSRRTLLAFGLTIPTTAALLSRPARAQSGTHTLPFELHATFFSHETHQPKPLDPQVFVADAAVQAGAGPQKIRHTTGFRPAFLADPHGLAAHNADGKALEFTLGAWLAAEGQVQLMPQPEGGTHIACTFSKLRPHGVYSLFENHFDQKPIGFTPLDGTGKTNSFTADAQGNARVAVVAPKPLTHANAVLLVYHSDGETHGTERGSIGVTAHHQLIARIPA